MELAEVRDRVVRERSRKAILLAAIDLFAERGVSGSSIAEITRRAGVAQGLMNYHFGAKEQLVAAVMDYWFETLFGIPPIKGTTDERLAGIIDSALRATGSALPLQRAVFALQQQPFTHRLFADSEERHAEMVVAAEDTLRQLFLERGAGDPALEEVMLRTILEGVFMKYAVYGDTFPLEDSRRWMYRTYDLPTPQSPLPVQTAAPAPGTRLRAAKAWDHANTATPTSACG